MNYPAVDDGTSEGVLFFFHPQSGYVYLVFGFYFVIVPLSVFHGVPQGPVVAELQYFFPSVRTGHIEYIPFFRCNLYTLSSGTVYDSIKSVVPFIGIKPDISIHT